MRKTPRAAHLLDERVCAFVQATNSTIKAAPADDCKPQTLSSLCNHSIQSNNSQQSNNSILSLFSSQTNNKHKMNSYAFAFIVIVACASSAMANLIAAPALSYAAPGLVAHAPAFVAHAPLLTAPAIVGHAPVAISHTPVAAVSHVGPAFATATISRPVATYATTHTLLGAPLAAPALLARPALPLAAPAVVAAPALAAPALIARSPFWLK